MKYDSIDRSYKKLFRGKRNGLFTAFSLIAILGVLIFGAKEVGALGTKAGTPIGNAATAIYFDEDNNEYTTESEFVVTEVAPVCGVNVTDGPLAFDAVAGQTIDIPLDIVNTGNSGNTFSLAHDATNFTTLIYLDDGDGVADATEVAAGAITSIELTDADQTGKIVIQVTTNASFTDETFTLTVTGTTVGTCNDTVDITTTVINDALINANKEIDKTTAVGGDTLTFNIPFSSNGTLAAKSITGITFDVAPLSRDGILLRDEIPTGTDFSAGSASGQPAGGPLGVVVYSTDSAATWSTTEPGTPADVTHIGFFMPDANPTDGISEAVLTSGQDGFLTFQVVVDDPFNEASLKVENVAEILYRLDDGTTAKTTVTQKTETTIPTSDTAEIAAGGLDESAADNSGTWTHAGGNVPWVNGGDADPNAEEDVEADGADPDSPDSYKDDNYISNVSAGQTIEFLHQVQNNSVIDDIINVEVVTTANLPTGAIVEFFNANGDTKLFNTNPLDDALLDVGTVTGGGGTKDIVVKVFIPANTAAVDLDGTVDYYVDIRFSSVNDPSETDLSRNNIDGVIGSGADLGAPDTVAGVDGVNNNQSDGDTNGVADSDDITTGTVSPGDSIDYPLHFANTGGSSDTFGLSASSLPTGASATFLTDPNCDGDPTDGVGVTSTGLVGGSVTVSGSTNTVVNVQSVANIGSGDRVIISDEQAEVASVNSGNNTITLTTALVGGAPAAGVQVAEYICLVMRIQVDVDADPADGNIVATATSPNSGESDSMDVEIVISRDCEITVTPPLSGQLPPGGSTSYTHTVINGSNFSGFVRIDLVATSPDLTYLFIAANGDDTTWFKDGGNGTIEGGGVGDDTFLLDGDTGELGSVYVQLAPSASAVFKIQVQAAESVPVNTKESVSFRTLLDSDGNFSITTDQCEGLVSDTTDVIEGFLSLDKAASVADTGTFNSLDGTCTGTSATPDPDGVTGSPCDTISYTVTYKNLGIQDAVDMIITDAIPNFTTYVANSATFDASCDGGVEEKPNAADTAVFDTGSNTITWTLTDPIAPGEEGCVLFEVTINSEGP